MKEPREIYCFVLNSGFNPFVALQTFIRRRQFYQECAICGDADPRRLESQSCSEWHHTVGQLLYELFRKYYFTFLFDSAFFHRDSVTSSAFRHIFLSASNNCDPYCIFAQNLKFVATSFPQCEGVKTVRNDELVPSLNLMSIGISRLRQSTDYCAKFQVIPITGFRSAVLTYAPPTHTHSYIVTNSDLHGDATNGNPAQSAAFPAGTGTDVAGFPPGWNLLLRKIRGVCLIKNAFWDVA